MTTIRIRPGFPATTFDEQFELHFKKLVALRWMHGRPKVYAARRQTFALIHTKAAFSMAIARKKGYVERPQLRVVK